MTNYIFQQLSKKGKVEGIDDTIRQRDTRTWFRNAAANIKSVNRNKMMNDPENVVNNISMQSIGQMYTFFYDPKHKKTLPYYDTFPLIFVINAYSDGFLGINLHYLPPILRAKLMDALYSTINNTKYDKTTQLNISYQILNKASKYKYFATCVKRYLSGHVQSKYLNIEVRMWDAALMLPTENFSKASSSTVWSDSKNKVP